MTVKTCDNITKLAWITKKLQIRRRRIIGAAEKAAGVILFAGAGPKEEEAPGAGTVAAEDAVVGAEEAQLERLN